MPASGTKGLNVDSVRSAIVVTRVEIALQIMQFIPPSIGGLRADVKQRKVSLRGGLKGIQASRLFQMLF